MGVDDMKRIVTVAIFVFAICIFFASCAKTESIPNAENKKIIITSEGTTQQNETIVPEYAKNLKKIYWDITDQYPFLDIVKDGNLLDDCLASKYGMTRTQIHKAINVAALAEQNNEPPSEQLENLNVQIPAALGESEYMDIIYMTAPSVIFSTKGSENGFADYLIKVDGTVKSKSTIESYEMLELKTNNGIIYIAKVPPLVEYGFDDIQTGWTGTIYCKYGGWSEVANGAFATYITNNTDPNLNSSLEFAMKVNLDNDDMISANE